MMIKRSPVDPIILGKIGPCYGVRGWIRISSSTEVAEDILRYRPWFVNVSGKWQEIRLERWRYHNQNILIKIKGIDDRNAVNSLKNCEIIVDSSQLPPLEEGIYYWKDLIGCQVFNTNEFNLGTVINIIGTGSNDVLIIKSTLKNPRNNKERLVPFLDRNIVKNVDLFAKRIIVDWDLNF